MASLQKALEPYDNGYDGWVHFFGASKSHPPFTTIINLGRVRMFLNISPIVFVSKMVMYT